MCKISLFDADKTVINKNLTIKLGSKRVSQIDILKKNQLSFKNIKTLYNFSKKIKIDFAVTATENEHVDFLNKMNLPFIKIASADIINHELIKYCIKKIKNKFLIISTGMANFDEIDKVVKLLKKKILKILFYCIV